MRQLNEKRKIAWFGQKIDIHLEFGFFFFR